MSDAKKLSSMDASFLYLETPEMPMHVGSMAIFRLPDDYKGDFFEEFKAMIASRLHVAPILKARLEKAPLDIDHPSWVEDDQFDIDRHIFKRRNLFLRRHCLPASDRRNPGKCLGCLSGYWRLRY